MLSIVVFLVAHQIEICNEFFFFILLFSIKYFAILLQWIYL